MAEDKLIKVTGAIAQGFKAEQAFFLDMLGSKERVSRLVQGVRFAIGRNPDLQRCDPKSIVMSAMDAVQVGLDPAGGVKGEGYLVPFKSQCQFIPGYRGLIKLLRESGVVVDIRMGAIHANDKWHYDEAEGVLSVQPAGFDAKERGEIKAYYATALLPTGRWHPVVMSTAEIAKVKRMSRASGGPWKDWEDEMAKKTVLRRLWKVMGSTGNERLSRAIELSDQEFDLSKASSALPPTAPVSLRRALPKEEREESAPADWGDGDVLDAEWDGHDAPGPLSQPPEPSQRGEAKAKPRKATEGAPAAPEAPPPPSDEILEAEEALKVRLDQLVEARGITKAEAWQTLTEKPFALGSKSFRPDKLADAVATGSVDLLNAMTARAMELAKEEAE